ncbi:serine/threonine-protein kinase [Microbispora sp. H10830]|uniref:serine/threonine-protein kinase n=1 Tax=Microbispora sp. H10830 TaxID=2729109 RepID=UPI001C71BE2C|nr:serine/threonine-protein kinase [Microbispora sp. H10830]
MRTFEALREDDPRQVGPFRIEARLGEGGMGRVYLGRSRSGRAVAVKVVRPELAGDADFRLRFDREVATARKVNGFFTAGVVDADPQGSPPWLATAYVPGVSLEDAVDEHGPWPEESVLALAAGLAEALESIHAAGVVHRDLKPSNVLLAGDGPRVIDFGISLAAEGGSLTKTGITMGTPGFMSPEQLKGTRVGPASDVFCLGLVLAFAATGTGPFGQGSWQGLWYRIVHEEPALDALPPTVRTLVARCLAKEPEARPALSAVLNELAGSGRDFASPTQQGRWLPPTVAQAVRTRVAPTRASTASPEPPGAPYPYMSGAPGHPRAGGGPGPQVITPGPRPAFPAPNPPYIPPAPYSAGPAHLPARPYAPPVRPTAGRRPRRYPAWLRRTTRAWAVLCGLLTAVAAVCEVGMGISATPRSVSRGGSPLTVALNPALKPAIYVSGASPDPRCKIETGRGRNARLARPAASYRPFAMGDAKWRLLYEIRAPKTDTYKVTCSGDDTVFGVGAAPSADVRSVAGAAVALLVLLAAFGVPALLLAALVTRKSRPAP